MFLKIFYKSKNESTPKLIPLLRKNWIGREGKRDYKPISFMTTLDANIPNKMLANSIQEHSKKIICHQLGFPVGMKHGSVYTNQ